MLLSFFEQVLQLEVAALSLTQSGKLFQTLTPDALSYRLVLTYEIESATDRVLMD